jgi:hypothetical protein
VGFQNTGMALDQWYQAANPYSLRSPQDRSPPDPAMDQRGNRRCWARRSQPQRTMRPRGVVVHGIPGKHPTHVSLPEDPRFINYRPDGSGDYRLQPSSPAVNGGFTDCSPSVAIEGTPRPQGSAVGCGVYEQ